MRNEESVALLPCDIDRIHTFELFCGLSFAAKERESAKEMCFCGKHLRTLCESVKTLKSTVVAFDLGVNGEKRMLERLRIPCIDLCYQACPPLLDCEFHFKGKASRCAQIKCKHFVEYINYFLYGEFFEDTIEADELRQEDRRFSCERNCLLRRWESETLK